MTAQVSQDPSAPEPGGPALSSPPASSLARCLSVSPQEFAEQHWNTAPLLSRAKQLPRDFADLITADDVDELIGERALRTPFFRTVSDGGGLPTPLRTARAGNRTIGDLVDADGLAAQHRDGATLVLQSLHRMHPPVGRFCRELALELGHPTQCNAYITPGGDAQGFDFHHDTHDVLVLQVSGTKRWVIHEPVLELPLSSQARAGADLVPEGAEPLMDIELEAGDCLYLPRGYVHAALTTDVASVHLTVGIMATTWYDVLNDLLTLAADEPSLRRALPVQPDADPGDLLDRASSWLQGLEPSAVRAKIDARLARAVTPEPVRMLALAQTLQTLSADVAIRPRRGLSVRRDGTTLHLPDRRIDLPVSTSAALDVALGGALTVRELAVGGFDEGDALVLARRLLREGVLVPGD